MSTFALMALAAAQASAVTQSPPPLIAEPKVTVYPAAFFDDFRPDTAFQMLSRLPGFQYDGGAVLRGFAGAEGNVRIDGQLPASRSDGLTSILQRTPASSVERIDLITGGARGIDMQGKTLIANVVLKKTAGGKRTATIGAGVYEDGRATPDLRLDIEHIVQDRRLEGSIYYYQTLDGGVGPRTRGLAPPITSHWDAVGRYAGGGISGAYEQPFAAGRLRVNGAVTAAPTASAQLDFPPAGAGVFPSAELTDRARYGGELGARYSRDFEAGGGLQLIAFQQVSRSDLDVAYTQGPTVTDFAVGRQLGESILRGVLRSRKHGAWSFDGGAEGAFNWLTSATDYAVNGAAVVLPAGDVRVEEVRGEAFATATWSMGPRLTLQGGLRYEASDISSEGAVALEKQLTYLKPRMVATWTPAKGHLAVVRIERVVDQLSFDDFSATASLTNNTIVAGNPNLEPQNAWLYEARYERRFGARGAFVATYIHREIDDIIGRNLFVTPQGVYEAQDNIGSGRRDSFTLSVSLPLDAIGFKGGLLRGVHVWRDSELIDPITLTPRRFSDEAPFAWELHLSQDLTARKMRWGADAYKTDQTYTYLTREIATATGTVLVSAFFEYRPRPEVTWRIEAVNLGDRNYATTREVYSAPRDVGVVNFRERRDLRRSLGGRGLLVTLRQGF